MHRLSRLLVVLAVGAAGSIPIAQGQGRPPARDSERREDSRGQANDPVDDRRMSAMGRAARLAATGRLPKSTAGADGEAAATAAADESGEPIELEAPAGGQGETSIAADVTGQFIVIGTNDTRGFSVNPISVSGFAYSSDGGQTFIDGGLLPVTVPTSTIGSTVYPQVFGDPEVKHLGGSTFLYFSIMVKKVGATGTAQTMGVHRSTDNGHTWQGPYEIPPATNPHGVMSGVNAADVADKEFADVDPETGRVMLTWSNFTSLAPGGVEISSTYSDDALTSPGAPTWSPRVIVGATASDGQASLPRFAGNGSANVYAAWRRFSAGGFQNIGFARSTNNGATFAAPINVAPANFFTMDHALGNDRANTSPSMAVDRSLGPHQGSIYIVYSNNDNHDGADIVVQKSGNQGVSFGAPVKINSRPGADRAQWFPWVTVDSGTGRVYVFYYDQGIAADGDLTETSYQYSDDGGATWGKPMPLTDRPFHAGYGNDTGQPNIGDYNQGIAQQGELFATWSGTPPLVSFTDGQPTSVTMNAPDMYFKRVPEASTRLAVNLGVPFASDAGSSALSGNGFIDAGEQVGFTLPLRNYVTNVLTAGGITGLSATLTTATPGVIVLQGAASYPDAAPGATVSNLSPFVISIAPAFVPGTRIELALEVSSALGSTSLPFTQPTGSPFATTILQQNFDGVAAGTLPAGWTTSHGAGANTVAWTTSALSLGAAPVGISNALFHANANDGPTPVSSQSRWERAFSPTIVIPAASEYVTVDFKIAYNTEDEPLFNVTAYDGALLRMLDATPGRLTRAVAVEAFAEEFTTGTAAFYPKHLNRDNDPAYFQDLSAWAGDSGGYRQVHLKLPGMAGSTTQLRFEYTQDSFGTCANVRPGHRCGILIDDIVVRSVTSITPTHLSLTSSLNPSLAGMPVEFTATVTRADGTFPADGSVTFREGPVVLAGPVPLVGGAASFMSPGFAAGAHPITASYSNPSGTLSDSTGSLVQYAAVPTALSLSQSSLSFGKQWAGSESAPQMVTVTNTGAESLVFSTFNGTPASASFAVGDFEGTTDCPVAGPGLSPGASCLLGFVFTPATAGPHGEMFSMVTNATGSPHTIALSGTGFVVDEATVVQTLTGAGARLLALQNPDGGWYFEAGLNSCVAGAPPGVSCVNITGVTALGMLAAYARTGDPALLAGLVAAGDGLVARFGTVIPSPLPYNQDIEFLVELSLLTGNPSYLETAEDWFGLVVAQYPDPEARIVSMLASRSAQLIPSAIAWDAASFIRAAKAVGNLPYAVAIANSVIAHEGDWKVTDPAYRPPANPFGFELTIVGEGSLLWGIHDLGAAFAGKIGEYTTFILAHQDPAGSWAGDLQLTAYVIVGLAAVGDAGANPALMSAAAFFIGGQQANGGWFSYKDALLNDVENVEHDGEVARAMATFFNTPAGEEVTVSQAQLSSVTFSTVEEPGRTRVVSAALPAGMGVQNGFTILSDLTYEVATSATFAGATTVCFSVSSTIDRKTFGRIRILHDEGGSLVDRTISSDFASRQVCASVSSLSTFAMAIHGEPKDKKDKDKKDKKDK